MCRVEAQRYQKRPHLAGEEGGHPAPLRRIALSVRQDLQPRLLQVGAEVVVVQRVLLVDQRVRRQRDVAHRRRADRLCIARVGQTHFFERVGHPDLEELVEVGRDDAQVAQPLQQGHVGLAGHVEHPCIERKGTQVAVQQ
jgi:hypothetical protein